MYINLFLGGVALTIIIVCLKKLLVRDDALTDSPTALLAEEIAKRRAASEDAAALPSPVSEEGPLRLRPVLEALKEIHAVLKQADKKLLTWDDAGEAVVLRMAGEFRERAADAQTGNKSDATQFPDQQFDATLAVTWRTVPSTSDIQGSSTVKGEYVLRYSDERAEEVATNIDACVRRIASFIVDFIE